VIGLDASLLGEARELLDLGGAFGLEVVEPSAQPLPEGAIARVGCFQLGDEPVLPRAEIGDLRRQFAGFASVALFILGRLVIASETGEGVLIDGKHQGA